MKNDRHYNPVNQGGNDEPPGWEWRTTGVGMTNPPTPKKKKKKVM